MRSLRPLVLALVLLIIASTGVVAEVYDSISAPDFQKRSLLNGMEFLFLRGEHARQPFVLMIKNGAAFDPVDKWGVTYLMTRLMLEGSERFDGESIREGLKYLDAKLDVRVELDAIFIEGSAPESNIPDVLELVSDLVIRPRFDEDAFERVRTELLEKLEERRQDVEVLTQEYFLAELFRGNPYEHTAWGTPETVRQIHLVDVRLQYRRLMMPNQAQLALYHSGDQEDLFRIMSRRWGAWVRERPAPFTFRPANPPEERRILLLDSSEGPALFRWGQLCVTRGAREYYPLRIFQHYLTLSLPDWARQVSSSSQIQASPVLEPRRMPGFLQLTIEAAPDQLIAYFRELERLLEDIEEGRIDVDRLEEARRLAFLEFKHSFEDPVSRLRLILETELHNLGVNYIANYGARLRRVSNEDFQSSVSEFLSPNRFVMLVVGPAFLLGPEMEGLGETEILH